MSATEFALMAVAVFWGGYLLGSLIGEQKGWKEANRFRMREFERDVERAKRNTAEGAKWTN